MEVPQPKRNDATFNLAFYRCNSFCSGRGLPVLAIRHRVQCVQLVRKQDTRVTRDRLTLTPLSAAAPTELQNLTYFPETVGIISL